MSSGQSRKSPRQMPKAARYPAERTLRDRPAPVRPSRRDGRETLSGASDLIRPMSEPLSPTAGAVLGVPRHRSRVVTRSAARAGLR